MSQSASDVAPVIFTHTSFRDYLLPAVGNAIASNGAENVIFVGDRTVVPIRGPKHISMAAHSREAAAFAGLYTHLSTNPYHVELICFQRWFVIESVMRSLGLSSAVAVDSDVLLFASTEELATMCPDRGLVFTDHPSATTDTLPPAFTFVRSLDVLTEFNAFLMSLYRERKKFALLIEHYLHLNQRDEPGGACDMTALSLFAQQHPDAVGFTKQPTPESPLVIDANVAQSEEGRYAMAGELKALERRSDRWWGHRDDLDLDVAFAMLHCQGVSKALMNELALRPPATVDRVPHAGLQGELAARRAATRSLQRGKEAVRRAVGR